LPRAIAPREDARESRAGARRDDRRSTRSRETKRRF